MIAIAESNLLDFLLLSLYALRGSCPLYKIRRCTLSVNVRQSDREYWIINVPEMDMDNFDMDVEDMTYHPNGKALWFSKQCRATLAIYSNVKTREHP